MTTLYVTHPRCAEHDLPFHPEHAGRIRAVWNRIEESGVLERVQAVQAEPVSEAQILAVHDADYLKALQSSAQQGQTLHLDSDTYINPQSYEISRLSAGGVVLAADRVLTGAADNAFVVTRPPGHHAVRQRGMGFCLLGNVAIGAQAMIDTHRLERVLIVDYDVHHGNGTEAIFYDRPDVMFISTHQYPLYPMTGAVRDIGIGKGEGCTLNLPMPKHCGDQRYIEVFERVIIPAARRYRPQLILVSAGYDAHWADPLAQMRLTLNGFAELGLRLKALADELCSGKIVFVMEGGYYVEALAYGMVNVGHILLGEATVDPLGEPDDSIPEPSLTALIEQVQRIHKL
ncbi:MAG: histone deacetylase [Anaerolineae bacterium]|nr:histone deacetylase [Anaerolineae bacterium]